jgi:hypothetical protein
MLFESSEGTSEPQKWTMKVTFYELVHKTVKNNPEYKSKQASKKNENLHNFSRSYFTLWRIVTKRQNQDTNMESKLN